jgi:aspartyl/asparaginyl beta-hydroxylase (cupin superfamily)
MQPTFSSQVVPAMLQIRPAAIMPVKRPPLARVAVKAFKRIVPTTLAIVFIPWAFAIAFTIGLVDVLRNRPWSLKLIDRYFFGNGVFTWLLAPFNLTIDLLCLPFRNRGIYSLDTLPPAYQAEIQSLIDAARDRDLVGLLEAKLGEKKRGMIFFKWYGKNIDASVAMPEYHAKFRYIRTIGVSIFNSKSSTGEHFGPLRVTLRVLYNINDIPMRDVYITVGDHTHYWQDQKLFIFDDTLQHQSCNQSTAVRYCLFVDMLRPSMMPWLLSGILSGIRLVVSPVRAVFYKHWSIIK